MILTDDKQVEALEARRLAEEQLQQEPPPTYASVQASSEHGVSTPIKPTNFVSITRVHDNVKEALYLDPSLYIPAFLLPPLGPGETEASRKNLKLQSTHGYVYAKVKLLPESADSSPTPTRLPKRRRVTMDMKSTHGSITAKILGPISRPPFYLKANSDNGNVQIQIPRTFHGPIVVSLRHGSVKFSDDINRHLTTFGEVEGTRRCFVGNFSGWANDAQGWMGDEVVIEARHGSVKIQYVDDVVGSVVKSRPSFLNRVFGF